MKPEISVIIPFYNSVSTLQRAVNSVISQDYQNWELILVNDGSKDSSEHIAKECLSDSRISYLSQMNGGVSAARNFGATKAKGEWFIFLDSDDEFIQDALEDFARIIRRKPETQIIKAGFIFKEEGRSIIHIPYKEKYVGHIPGSFAIKKSFFVELGGYDARLKFAENTELFFRIGSSGKSLSLLFKATVNYFDNENGGSKNLKNCTDSIILILEKHNDTIPYSTKRLYHQILGVNFMRFGEFSLARKHLLLAYKFDLKRLDTLIRFIISCFPPLAKKLYPANPR